MATEREDGKTTRAEFLQRGAVGLTLIWVAPAVLGGCKSNPQVRDSMDADLAEMGKTDAKDVLYKEMEPIQTGMARPRGVAATQGSIAIVGDNVLSELQGGSLVKRAEFQGEPRCAAYGPDGIVAVGLEDRVAVVGKSGEPALWPSLGPRSRLTCLAFDGPELLVADAGRRIVWRYDLGGKQLGKLCAKADGYPGLDVPSAHLDVSVGAKREVFVSNPGMHRIETHKDGKFGSSWGKQSEEPGGFCGCCNPTNFAVMPNGDFVTSEKGLPRVKLYAHDGTFKGFVAPPSAFLKNVVGLALAVQDKRILVLDPLKKAVRVFEPKEVHA